MSQNENTPAVETDLDVHDPETRRNLLQQALIGVVGAVVLGIFFPDTLRMIVVFVVMLSTLVFVHEWGHYQFARWAGMKVNRFAIGFPPFIYTRRKNGIDYSIGALPIGGMVDIAGLGSEEEMVGTVKGETAPARRDTTRPFGQRQYQDANLFWRFMVIFAGPLMNFIFAITVAIIFFSLVGAPDGNENVNRVGLTLPGSPAAKAGLQMGDLIVGVNGTKTRKQDEISKLIKTSQGQFVTLDIERGSEKLNIKVEPKSDVFEDPKVTGRQIGIQYEPDPKTYKYVRLNPWEATKGAFITSYRMSTQVLSLVGRALTFRLSDVDKASIGGPVNIARRAGQASRDGWAQYVTMAIGLSMNLGLMNLLPFPALDGGRIVFLGFEFVTRRPFNPRWEGIVHAGGMLMLLSFMLFITLRDVNAGAFLEKLFH